MIVAEQFGTLESLFPGRIDLGLGRAPGTDPTTARALRRTLASNPDAFPHDVLELLSYFHPENGQPVNIYDHTARLRSYEIVADVAQQERNEPPK